MSSARKKKKITLDSLAALITESKASADKKFEALADDMGELATKADVKEILSHVVDIHDQVNSIERQLRETKTEVRLSNLEEKVFGASRA